MIGYPSDPYATGGIMITENCWVQSSSVRNPYRGTSYWDNGMQDEVFTHNCTTYGGNSGGPMIGEGTNVVFGMPYAYRPDDFNERSSSESTSAADLADFIRSHRRTLDQYQVAIGDVTTDPDPDPIPDPDPTPDPIDPENPSPVDPGDPIPTEPGTISSSSWGVITGREITVSGSVNSRNAYKVVMYYDYGDNYQYIYRKDEASVSSRGNFTLNASNDPKPGERVEFVIIHLLDRNDQLLYRAYMWYKNFPIDPNP
ncbi:MAG: hypothetical protein D3907_04135, partial [Candidatus Electrothrix sp. AUS3]|nr:hypothetical protein [Candidatus Electrothrix gigas]